MNLKIYFSDNILHIITYIFIYIYNIHSDQNRLSERNDLSWHQGRIKTFCAPGHTYIKFRTKFFHFKTYLHYFKTLSLKILRSGVDASPRPL